MISVVIPVHGVADYLADCLDSVLGQPYRDVEVVAVDDHSPDACGAILDARAAREPRLRVIHLTASGGPGPARNAGLAQATGEYAWCVDGDDMLADGALQAVAERLAAGHPDVLLVEYEALYPSGRTTPDPGEALLRAAAAAPAGLRLAARPELINLTMTSWSKVIRLAFLRELGAEFGPGIHEDVPVSSAVLLAAERISALDRVSYRYRRRSGSFLSAKSAANFSIFASYQQVFDLMDRLGTDGAVRNAVFGRAMWHYTTTLPLVPWRRRREFFRRMSADSRRLRPAGYQHPGGARGVKLRLVERGAYWTYTLLEPLNRLRVAASAAGRRGEAR